MHPRPLISIIVVTYNSSKYVIETLESVRNLTYNEIELIVTDDSSSDNTIKVCENWIALYKSRFVRAEMVVSEKNTGIAANCNRGLHASKGEWIKLIAGDDALEPGFIEEYLNYINNNEDVHVLSSNVHAYDELLSPECALAVESLAHVKFNDHKISAKEQFKILLRQNFISAPTVMMRRRVIQHLGGFNEDFPFLEDWPMWLCLTNAGYKIHFIDIVSAKYRRHNLSINSGTYCRIYKTRVELSIDRMYKNKYIVYLPLIEKVSKHVEIYRNEVILKLFSNKKNVFISMLSKAIGAIPVFILRQYRKRII